MKFYILWDYYIACEKWIYAFLLIVFVEEKYEQIRRLCSRPIGASQKALLLCGGGTGSCEKCFHVVWLEADSSPFFGSTDFIKRLENSALTPESLRGWTQPNALIFSFACQGVLLAVTAPFHTAPGALRLGFVNHLVCIMFRLPSAHVYSAHKIWANI